MKKITDTLVLNLQQIFWSINRYLVPVIMRRNFGAFELAEDADALPKPPFIMVSNHNNFSDPWIVAHFSPKRVSIMMNEEGFKSNFFTRWYLRNIGAFPKKKGLSDISAMKISLRRLRSGSPLLVFPEGQTSWDGETQPIYSGLEKIAKRANVPLVINRIQGNFLCHPWWSTKRRKGEIIVHRKVLSTEQVQALSSNEIQGEMLRFINQNDIKQYQKQTDLFSGSEIAGGLQQLLWVCPKCGSDTGLRFTLDSVACKDCDTLFRFYPNMTLVEPINATEDLYDWVALQKKWAKDLNKSMVQNGDSSRIFASEQGIRLIRVDYGGRKITLDTGSLELKNSTLIFLGEDGQISFNLGDIVAPVFQLRDILQFDFQGNSYQFLIEDRPLFKWLFLLRYATGYADAEECGVFK